MTDLPRRALLGAVATAGLVLGACAKGEEPGEEVSAPEDLMREHGVLRRVLVVYREAAPLIVSGPERVDAGALAQAATLFRRFGEDYHERTLEEQRVFPDVQKAGGPATPAVAGLLAQHQRGREITAYVERVCAGGRIGAADAAPLAQALSAMARMYEAHTAWEDTVVFPAWKKTMSGKALDEVSEQFEDIEHKTFGGDGFDWALGQVAEVERRLGLGDLGRYTAPPVA
jgi:hemerythrin-like domain-containing protein